MALAIVEARNFRLARQPAGDESADSAAETIRAARSIMRTPAIRSVESVVPADRAADP